MNSQQSDMCATTKVNINAHQSDICAINKINTSTTSVQTTSSMHTSTKHITHYHGDNNFILLTLGFV